MDSKEFGALIKALRSQSLDPSGSPWSREKLAHALGLSSTQLGRLERGDRKYLDNQTMLGLAECFNLTNLETRELFFAACGLSDRELYSEVEHSQQINRLIKVMGNLRVPSVVVDVYGDVVAAPAGSLALYGVSDSKLAELRENPVRLNIVNHVYSLDYLYRGDQASWRETADLAMLYFRRSTLRYRHKPYFSTIYRELMKNVQFDLDWFASQRMACKEDISFEAASFDHPVLGPLSYIICETVVYTRHGELYLIIYNPASVHTVKVFEALFAEGGNTIRRVAPWPEKAKQ